MKVEFIDGYEDEHGVQPICDALRETAAGIAPSTYYAATTRLASARAVRDAELTAVITTMYEENYHVYGARKIWKEMGRAGHEVAGCTVERLMKAEGLKGVQRAKSPRTTRPRAETDRPADLVDCKFVAESPNQLWVAGITYIRTFSGWVYAALIIDVYSPMVVGWQVSNNLYADLALDAVNMAIWQRGHAGADLSGLIHHSDRGVEYRALRYAERLAEQDLVASVGSRGDSYDNALAEALNSLFKAEHVRNRRTGPWSGIDDLEIAVAEYIDWFNHRRIHGEIGYVPPAEYEEQHTVVEPSPEPVDNLVDAR